MRFEAAFQLWDTGKKEISFLFHKNLVKKENTYEQNAYVNASSRAITLPVIIIPSVFFLLPRSIQQYTEMYSILVSQPRS